MTQGFIEVPNILTCGTRSIFIVVESHCPYCWNFGAVRQLSKLCPGRNPELALATPVAPKPAAMEEIVVVEKPSPSNWTEMVRKGKKPVTFSTQHNIPPNKVVSPKLQRK